MNYFRKLALTLGLALTLLCGLYPASDVAICATGPKINVLPAITAGITVPARLATDASGNIYATDPRLAGVLKFSNAGKILQTFVTPKNVAGIAVAKDGNLLVSQAGYVAVLNPDTGAEINRFGTFGFANGIAVDVDGDAYVVDSKNNNLKKFTFNSGSGTYNLAVTSDPDLLFLYNPTGIAYDKFNDRIVVANTLVGSIEFVDPVDLAGLETVGSLGYAASPVYPAVPLFSSPQGIALEYNPQSGALDRIYVTDSYQANIEVLDGATNMRIADLGGYGFTSGKLFVPVDVALDQFSVQNKRLLVSNGGGAITVFGIDNMQPTNITVGSATVNSLTVSWTNPVDPGFSRTHIYRSASAEQLGVQVGGELLGTSYTDTGLSPATTYYYTVRAVNTNNDEITNTIPVAGTTRTTYTLTLTTTSGGTINGTVVCGENTTCQSEILDNTQVLLTAMPNASSVFRGWTGACSGMTDTCTVTMTGAKSVAAAFNSQMPAKVDGNYFNTLQEAYNAATEGSEIQIMAGMLSANTSGVMVADRNITIVLQGGYNSEFTNAASSDYSTVSGKIIVQAGKLVIRNVNLRP